MTKELITPAGGERPDAHQDAMGIEAGLAAAQAPALTGNARRPTSSSEGSEQPAAAAVSERCWRKVAPTFTEQCSSEAGGGVKLLLFPALTLQKRYGKRPMLSLILDLPVCAGCFALMSAREVLANGLADGQWGAISKEAQRRNKGILPIKECSEIEHLPFADPEYTALREHIAKERAKDSQPAPAGPQREGAGDGTAG